MFLWLNTLRLTELTVICSQIPPQTTTQVSQGCTLILPFPFLLLHVYHMIMLWFNSHACASTVASVRSILGGSHPDTTIISGLEAPLNQLLR